MISITTLAQPVAALVLAPLLPGVINRTKAFFAGRRGQPLLQGYYDLWRLLHKGAVYSTATSWVFRTAPIVCLAAVVPACFIVPAGNAGCLLGFNGDLILFAYLLALARFFIVIAALDTASSFEGMGASREVHFSALAEPALLLALAAVARETSSISLSTMFAALTPSLWSGSLATLLLAAAAIIIVLLSENCRIPVDDPNTHLELTMIHEVMVLDNSGPDFAFILYTAALKLWLFGTILVNIVLPTAILPAWLAIPVCGAAVLAMGIVVGVIESCMARLRLVHVPHLLLAANALAVLALVFALRK